MLQNTTCLLRSVASTVVPRRSAVAAAPAVRGFAEVAKKEEAKLLLPYAEHARLGGPVELAWARYNVDDNPHLNADSAPTHAVVSWVSPEFVGRKARIFRQSQSAMTSGRQETYFWTIEFDHKPKWSSPFFGYLSSADPQKRITEHVRFDSAEQAVLFAKRNGWSYEVSPFPEQWVNTKNYSFNFLPERIEKRIKNLGPRGARQLFDKPTADRSQWINHHHTDYGEHKWRPKSVAAQE